MREILIEFVDWVELSAVPEISHAAILYVEQWLCGYNTRFYLRLNDVQRDHISRILDKVRHLLPVDIAESVESQHLNGC